MKSSLTAGTVRPQDDDSVESPIRPKDEDPVELSLGGQDHHTGEFPIPRQDDDSAELPIRRQDDDSVESPIRHQNEDAGHLSNFRISEAAANGASNALVGTARSGGSGTSADITGTFIEQVGSDALLANSSSPHVLFGNHTAVEGFAGSQHIPWRDASTGDVGFWQMQNGADQGLKDLGVVPTNWHVANLGDFDGTGKDAILWRNQDTGELGFWNQPGPGAQFQSLGAPTPQWTPVGLDPGGASSAMMTLPPLTHD